jgi:hypothetical protein
VLGLLSLRQVGVIGPQLALLLVTTLLKSVVGADKVLVTEDAVEDFGEEVDLVVVMLVEQVQNELVSDFSAVASALLGLGRRLRCLGGGDGGGGVGLSLFILVDLVRLALHSTTAIALLVQLEIAVAALLAFGLIVGGCTHGVVTLVIWRSLLGCWVLYPAHVFVIVRKQHQQCCSRARSGGCLSLARHGVLVARWQLVGVQRGCWMVDEAAEVCC